MPAQPTNINFLAPVNFRFSIKKAPNLTFFCTGANIPGITLGESDQETPLIRVPVPGDHLTFGELTVSFKVDEDLKNYKEMYDWIINAGFPESFEQYNDVGDAIFSDCTLSVLSSKQNVVADITFQRAYITTLSDLIFSSTESDLTYIEAQATFRYKLYNITLYN